MSKLMSKLHRKQRRKNLKQAAQEKRDLESKLLRAVDASSSRRPGASDQAPERPLMDRRVKRVESSDSSTEERSESDSLAAEASIIGDTRSQEINPSSPQ